MRRWDLINAFINACGYESYLEIGLSKGKNFNRIDCSLKDSVDPAEGKYAGSNPKYKMISDDFFEKVAPGLGYNYDLVFIDGLHISEQVDKDIHNSIRYLNANGSIVLHDCNPIDENRQKVPPIQAAWNGDVWKSVVRLRSSDSPSPYFRTWASTPVSV